jgi:hypothetical protein
LRRCDTIEAAEASLPSAPDLKSIFGLSLKQFPVNRSDLLQGTIASRSFAHRVWIALTTFHVGPLGSVDQFFVIELLGRTYSPGFSGKKAGEISS